jgi:arginine/lysine/ornithine decarboxylase
MTQVERLGSFFVTKRLVGRDDMAGKKQNRAPIVEALENFKKARIMPFDVPGHKRGKGNSELADFLGVKCVGIDANSQKSLDNLCHPVSVIKEAEELAAEAFGASHAFFMVNGTSSAVQTMILATCKKGDKIIIPRNVHRSAINSLVLCGAVPVYVNPGLCQNLGITLGMSVDAVKAAILANKDAKAVFINNPTYYGICSNLKEITALAHEHGMKVLVDEAHGTHFYFHNSLPPSAMEVGADMSAVSMHKSGGSLTQSSFLLLGETVNPDYMRQIINLTQTTSGSYLLMSSLDLSRRNLAMHGESIFAHVIEQAEYAREEINLIGDYYAFSKELTDGDAFYDYDITKLSVNTLNVGLAGIEIFNLLRDEYDIQLEFGDLGNFLAYISVGDRDRDIERLVGALAEIRRLYKKDKLTMIQQSYINPLVMMTPQDAFYAEKRMVDIKKSEGFTAAEFVMCYPPGIPIVAPGERITKEIIDYIQYSKDKGSFLTGTMDSKVDKINVVI